MSDAIKALRDYLSKSPSMIYPQDVLEYLPAIEQEFESEHALVVTLQRDGELLRESSIKLRKDNAKLREHANEFWSLLKGEDEGCPLAICPHMFECGGWCVYEDELRELGVEVDG